MPSKKSQSSPVPPKTSNEAAAEAAREAGLHWVTDAKPGIRRLKAGKGFKYKGPDGKAIKDKATLDRIRALAIPPAYHDVWICPSANGHLQATGIDDRGRKQPRYHPRWREARDENKYGHLLEFGAALPKIRRATRKHLRLQGVPREKILATIVQLLEKTLIRVGNEEYARTNKSRGLTTLLSRDVTVKAADVTFCFPGKSRIRHCIDLHDGKLAKVLKKLTDLPGQELFQYIDKKGATHSINSTDVNAYLKEISGAEFTAKDFRTWTGTLAATLELKKFDDFKSETEAKKNVVAAIDEVAKQLGNTRAVCRKSYIHPAVIERYLEGTLAKSLTGSAVSACKVSGVRADEAALMRLLRAHRHKK